MNERVKIQFLECIIIEVVRPGLVGDPRVAGTEGAGVSGGVQWAHGVRGFREGEEDPGGQCGGVRRDTHTWEAVPHPTCNNDPGHHHHTLSSNTFPLTLWFVKAPSPYQGTCFSKFRTKRVFYKISKNRKLIWKNEKKKLKFLEN